MGHKSGITASLLELCQIVTSEGVIIYFVTVLSVGVVRINELCSRCYRI